LSSHFLINHVINVTNRI